VAHLAYTYGLGGAPLPAEAPWSVNLLEGERVMGDAAAARSAGAEFVVVSMHAGIEYQRAPSAEQTAMADRLLASDDIDLLIGHHVHVIQPVDRVHDKFVAYGLGNFLSNQSPDAGLLASTQDGMILRVTVEEGPAGRFSATGVTFTPTFVDRAGGYVVRPVDATSNTASYQRTVEAVGALGVDGVVPDR
jgi:poly-gamma-glutamate capsule biosynthesis protein CapA/YwtB (metallophosphatase superfamily)